MMEALFYIFHHSQPYHSLCHVLEFSVAFQKSRSAACLLQFTVQNGSRILLCGQRNDFSQLGTSVCGSWVFSLYDFSANGFFQAAIYLYLNRRLSAGNSGNFLFRHSAFVSSALTVMDRQFCMCVALPYFASPAPPVFPAGCRTGVSHTCSQALAHDLVDSRTLYPSNADVHQFLSANQCQELVLSVLQDQPSYLCICVTRFMEPILQCTAGAFLADLMYFLIPAYTGRAGGRIGYQNSKI